MRSTDALFGLYRPGTSPWHRAGVGRKYLVVLVLTLPALIVQQPWLTAVALLAATGCLLGTGLPARSTLTVGWGVCGVRWTTHDSGGLTARDFDAARQTDLLDPGPDALPAPDGARR